MINKATKRGGIWENFGQKELRQLKDKVKYNPYSHENKDKENVEAIDELEHWCSYFDLSQLR